MISVLMSSSYHVYHSCHLYNNFLFLYRRHIDFVITITTTIIIIDIIITIITIIILITAALDIILIIVVVNIINKIAFVVAL